MIGGSYMYITIFLCYDNLSRNNKIIMHVLHIPLNVHAHTQADTLRFLIEQIRVNSQIFGQECILLYLLVVQKSRDGRHNNVPLKAFGTRYKG